ncbi:MAG TPA: TonB-dependent receptor, partial [Vicinamibacterales bacterium]
SAFAATTGNMFGLVTDASGAALPGVTVTVTSPQLQGSRSAVTDAKGEYQLSLLPPGTYRVEFALGGFDTIVKQNIKISLDTTTRQDATMALGAVTEAITVTAEAVVVDPTQTTVQQNFGTQHLKYATIGSAGRSYQSVLAQAPGVVGTGNPQVMGANLGQNNYMLDGVNTTDPVTHTFGSNLPFDAVQEVSIQTLGKDAEYGRALGGVVNVVTKTGGNEFSGTFDARITNDNLSESGEHYDASKQDYQEFKPAATLGGPISRDKVWFFGSLERPDNSRANTPRPNADWAPGNRTFKGWNSLAKITATPLPNHTLSFRFTDNRADIENSRDSSFYRPEADSFQEQKSTIYNLGYDAIINPNWLATVQVGIRRGYLESRPMSGDLGPVGISNLSNSINWVNYTNNQGGDRNRNELIASTTYFLNAMGSHTVKAGINFDWAEFNSFNNATGTDVDQSLCATQYGQPAGAVCGAIQYNTGGSVTNPGNPYLLYVSTINPAEKTKSDLQAYYVQDEWHPVTPLTLRLGLRYEQVGFDTPGTSAPSMDMLQPRIGVAYDVFNNARTVVHGFWGQVMDDNGLTLSSFLSTLGTVTSIFGWNGTGWEFIQPSGGASGNTYDPSLKPTYGVETDLGFTQRIWTNTSLDLTAVWRDTKDIFEDSCREVDCETGVFWLTNSPAGRSDALKAKYQGYIAKVETRPYSWLSGLLSYTYSKSQGSVEYTQNAGSDFDVYPDHFVNRYGYMSDDARNRVKASGFVRAPFGTTLGIDYSWRSGAAYSVTAATPPNAAYGTLYVEPRGSRRTPSLQQLDMQVMHELTFGRVKAGLVASVFNVFNSETATSIGGSIGTYANCRTSGATIDANCIANPLWQNGETRTPATGSYEKLRISSTTFGKETAWQRPRRYEVGVRFEF